MEKLTVTASPHFRSSSSTSKVMLAVIIALAPSAVMGCVYFGLNAVFSIVVGVASAVLSEFLYQKITKQPVTIGDFSAAVTGLLVSMNLSSTTPLWMVALGSVVAIVVVKQLFGGLGCNFANPAIVGRIVVTLCFANETSKYVIPFTDGQTGATLLPQIASGEELPSVMSAFLGVQGGTIGEVCALALILGGVFLCVKKIISPAIPVTYIATVFVMTALLGKEPLYAILSGGLMLGAIFMATDYVTSPLTLKGKIIFGVGCGVITTLIRLYGANPEGVSYAILFMNVLTPLIDGATMKRSPFALYPKKKKEAESK